jgi:hypothetical protein
MSEGELIGLQEDKLFFGAQGNTRLVRKGFQQNFK